ncbi:MAG: glutaredoxin family protein [Gammaproteobacteria bacterium]|jgi:glutaredoxin
MTAEREPARRTRTWWPLVLAIVGMVAVMQFVQAPDVAPVMCDSDVAADAVDVLMLSASWCGYCARARQMFVKDGINYCEYDVEQTKTGAELYARSGVRGVPIIYVGEAMFVGFNPHEIKQALVAEAIVSLDRL